MARGFMNVICRSQPGNFLEESHLHNNRPPMVHRLFGNLKWDPMDNFYHFSPVQLLMVSLPGHSGQSCRCTFICPQIRRVMCLDTRSRSLISFGMISHLATGMRLGQLISMLISPRYVLTLAVTSVVLTCDRCQSVQHNGSMWADIFLVKGDATPDPQSSNYNPLFVHHVRQCT